MACDSDIVVQTEKQVIETEIKNDKNKERKKMSSSMVLQKTPEFKMDAYNAKTGEVCPAGWREGKKTLPVNTDVEKMTGRVGDYIESSHPQQQENALHIEASKDFKNYFGDYS